jgi:hypothetical protein
LILKKEKQVMRTRTQLSTLAIAAIAILAAATTSFAQTNDRGAETTSAVTVSGNELTAINTKQPATIENAVRENTVRESFAAKSVSETRPVVKPLTLSAATFSAGSRFATIDANQFLNQQLTTDMKMSAGVSSTANEFGATRTRNVDFVACRVPKTPFKE